jgi:ribokinase
MNRKPRIVVVGSLVFDFVARAERLPRKGETLLGNHFGMYPGGKGANQAVQASRLGAEVHLVGRIGTDFLGDRLLDSLRDNQVRSEYITRDSQVNTAACCIHVDDRGDNTIVIVPQANQTCSAADVDAAADVIRHADVVLCQLEIALPAVFHAVRLAAGCQVPVILNPAPVQFLPREILSLVTYLTPNEPETQTLASTPAPAEEDRLAWASQTARRLLEQGPRHVVLTLADLGCLWATSGQEIHVPAFPVKAVDATAAGDAFNGALAVAVAEGREWPDALRWANAAGALAATRAGAQPSLPTRAEVEALLAKNPN